MQKPEKLTRPKRRLEGLRDRVLDEAWALLIERGLADLTLAELGRRVETSAGHLLYHFGSKDDLLLELLRRNENELWETWRLERQRDPGFAVLFDAFCRQFLPSGQSDPRWLVWLELWPRALRSEAIQHSLDELDEVWRVELTELLSAEGIADARQVARRICWMLDGLAVAITVGEDGASVEVALEHASALLP